MLVSRPLSLRSVGDRPAVYGAFPTISIGYLSVLYLKLYFLPKDRSVPPRDPPRDIQHQTVIFECLSPEEAEVVRVATRGDDATSSRTHGLGDLATPAVNRCWKGRCQGRWKPARTRHCSECGACRAGFDHHCAIVRLHRCPQIHMLTKAVRQLPDGGRPADIPHLAHTDADCRSARIAACPTATGRSWRPGLQACCHRPGHRGELVELATELDHRRWSRR